MKKILIVLSLSLLMSGISFAASQVKVEQNATSASSEPDQSAIYLSENQKIVPQSQHEEDKTIPYKINLTYPQIVAKNLSGPAKQFNQIIETIVKQETEQFKKYVLADMPHMQSLPEEVKHNTLDLDYDIDLVKPKKDIIISVRLSLEGYQAGRAHPYHTFRVVTFNLGTGKEMTLNELFKPNSHYLNLLSQISQKILQDKLKDKWMIKDGTKPIAKNYKNWNLEDDDLLITFDEYQVAPYYYGKQEVEIPYPDLKSVISEDSVIYPCVLNPKQCKIEQESPLAP